MIITSLKNNVWQKGKETSNKGYELTFGTEIQTMRGFGTCFSELGAVALNKLPESEKSAILDEIFGKDGGFVFNSIHNLQACTPIKNIVAMLDAFRKF